MVKNARLEEAERIDRACARIFEGFFLLANRPDLFERFRRALRRRLRRASGASPEPDPGPPEDGVPPQGDERSEVEAPAPTSSED